MAEDVLCCSHQKSRSAPPTFRCAACPLVEHGAEQGCPQGESESFGTPTETNVHGDALCFLIMGPCLLQRLAVDGWRLVVGGGWQLVVGGWWLAVGGWRRLAVGGWQLVVGGGWRLVVGSWWLAVGGWQLVVGGGWRLAVGGWRRLAVGGWWSLGAVLNNKKIWLLKDSPGVDGGRGGGDRVLCCGGGIRGIADCRVQVTSQ